MLDDDAYDLDPAATTTDISDDPGPAVAADDGLAAFIAARSRLFGIAYRVVGSAADAEDVLQDVWLRWQATDRTIVVDATGFLVTMTTRLAINAACSARSRRSTALEPWLADAAGTAADPAQVTERSEALGIAVFLLLEKLPPTERAVYVLGHAFDYSYAHIAEILQVSEANARQLASRARKHLAADAGQPVRPAAQQRLLETFRVAARSGELTALKKLLVADVAGDSPRPALVPSLESRASLAGREAAPHPRRAERKIEPRRYRRPGLLASLHEVGASRSGTDRGGARRAWERASADLARRTA